MDILQQQYSGGGQNKKPSKSKKMVLYFLAISIILFVLALIGMVLLKGKGPSIPISLTINETPVDYKKDNLLVGIDNTNYISLEGISKLIGFNYVRGGYLEYEENNSKCYLESNNQIIGFESESNTIFKTSENATTDYEYYELKNNIKEYDNILYISLDDLNVGLNVVYKFIEKENRFSINTIDKVIELNSEKLKNNGFSISTNLKNEQAISYGLYVVTGENRKMGIVNEKLETIVGNRYDSIEFDEYSQIFIVKDDSKYGIIDNQGKQLVKLKYEDIKIINYSPLLYMVKDDGKYGLLDDKFNEVLGTEYNSIGTTRGSKEERILLVKNIGSNKVTGIVVNKDNKYGIMNLKTGDPIIECNLEDIFMKKVNNKYEIYVKASKTEMKLDELFESENEALVNLANAVEQEDEKQEEPEEQQEQENEVEENTEENVEENNEENFSVENEE